MAPKSRAAGKRPAESSHARERRVKLREDRVPELCISPQDLEVLVPVSGKFGKIMDPRYVDFAAMSVYLPTLASIFETQGWTHFMASGRSYHPGLVFEFFNNLSYHQEDNMLYTSIDGSPFRLTTSLFSRALDIPDAGDSFQSADLEDSDDVFFTITGDHPGPLETVITSNANTFPPLAHILHHMITTIIYPKAGSRGQVSEMNEFILFYLLKEQQINLPMVILEHLRGCYNNSSRSIGYACHITEVLRYIGFKIPKKDLITVSGPHIYDDATLKLMGYKFRNNVLYRVLRDQQQAPAAPAVPAAPDAPVAHDDDDDAPPPPARPAPVPVWQNFMASGFEAMNNTMMSQFERLTTHFDARFDQVQGDVREIRDEVREIREFHRKNQSGGSTSF